MKKTILPVLMGMLLLFSTGTTSYAGEIDPGLDEVLRGMNTGDQVSVIVSLSEQVDVKKFKDKNKSTRRAKLVKALKSHATSSQKTIKTFLKGKGVKHPRSFWIFNGLALTADAQTIRELAGRPDVGNVRLNETFTSPQPDQGVQAGPEWNIGFIGAPALWDLGLTGEGVVIATMDTGVDADHADLGPRRRNGDYSWYDPNGEHDTPYDHSETAHGTAVMGVILGGDATGTRIGVAPGAQWIAVKIFNDQGMADLGVIHDGFQWLLDPDGNPQTDDAPDVVNNSWGIPNLAGECYQEFQPDIEAFKTAGIAMVFAAGNSGPLVGSDESPANNPGSFAVGSVDDIGLVASTSSRGPSACDGSVFPELAAPGVSITTADKTFGGAYPALTQVVSGTSIAAPHAAGAMALLIQAFPGISVQEIEDALLEKAWDLGDTGPNNDYGSGLIDVEAAYAYLDEIYSGCTDDDGDGFYATEGCGAVLDCNDVDPSIYPGAPEEKSNEIDEDCNGYDLTIDITAEYLVDNNKLNVEATSALGKDAGLGVEGYGPMKWSRKKALWSLSVSGVAANPGLVIVSGVEGSDFASPVEVSDGGGGGKGKPKKK